MVKISISNKNAVLFSSRFLITFYTKYYYCCSLDCIEEYFTNVMAGLAGSPHMISGTLLAFTKMVFEYRCMNFSVLLVLKFKGF